MSSEQAGEVLKAKATVVEEPKKEEEVKEETVLKKDFDELGRAYFQNQVFIFEAYKLLRDVGHDLVQQGSKIQELLQKNENLTAVAVSEVLNQMNKQRQAAQVKTNN